jgi:hypothetical protein
MTIGMDRLLAWLAWYPFESKVRHLGSDYRNEFRIQKDLDAPRENH